jgi:hypothetical protein
MEEWVYKIRISLTLALVGSEWSASPPPPHTKYEGRPQSKFPWRRFSETKHNFMEIFIATDPAIVQLFSNIVTTGIETFVIPWDQIL